MSFTTLAWPKRAFARGFDDDGGNDEGGGGGSKIWWEESCDLAAFEPHLPDLARCGLPVPNE